MSTAPCLYRGPKGERCYAIVSEGGGRCAQHTEKAWFNPNREPTSKLFTQNKRTVKARARGICENQPNGFHRCSRLGTEVDHIIPVAEGGSDALFNLRLLCSECHSLKSREESIAGIAGRKPRLRGHQ